MVDTRSFRCCRGGADHLLIWQVLSLAATLVASLDALGPLRALPRLTELTCDDPHFGAAPVAELDGYARALVGCMPQLRVLDGRAVSAYPWGATPAHVAPMGPTHAAPASTPAARLLRCLSCFRD